MDLKIIRDAVLASFAVGVCLATFVFLVADLSPYTLPEGVVLIIAVLNAIWAVGRLVMEVDDADGD